MNIFMVQAIVDHIVAKGDEPFIGVMPHLAVEGREALVPLDYVVDGLIELNVATRTLGAWWVDLDNGVVELTTRFNRISYDLSIPIECITHIRGRTGKMLYSNETFGALMHNAMREGQRKPALKLVIDNKPEDVLVLKNSRYVKPVLRVE